jgi:hypothetical protein
MVFKIAAIACLLMHGLSPRCAAICLRTPARAVPTAAARHCAGETSKQRACCRPAARTCKAACSKESSKPKAPRRGCCEVCRLAKEPLTPVIPTEKPRAHSTSIAPLPVIQTASDTTVDGWSLRVRGEHDPPSLVDSHNDRQAQIAVWQK